ncbi:MAG: type VI secretion system contractile sheath small subunit [Sulfurovum sp.]|nr:type VI secretion system contractile sheath small subunit [Sulfurovum sp.]
MSQKQSESPKERINVTYKPATGDQNEDIEIPFKLMVLGDFNPNEEFTTVEDKKPISVNKNNFNDVLQEQKLTLDMTVDNKLTGTEEDTLNLQINFNSMKDFSPENIVEQVDELKKLQELRESLMSLKGPLGNIPAFRKAISDAIDNPEATKKLLTELGIEQSDSE